MDRAVVRGTPRGAAASSTAAPTCSGDGCASQAHSRSPANQYPGEWSTNEVLAHLRACGDMWGGCIKAILAENHPTLRAVNPQTWIEKRNYRELEFAVSLQAFTEQRAELLDVLRPLLPEGWLRAATVSVAGKPFERTVQFYAEWLATHERPHVKQIERIVRA